MRELDIEITHKQSELELIQEALDHYLKSPKEGTVPQALNKMQKLKESIEASLVSMKIQEYFWDTNKHTFAVTLYLGDMKNKTNAFPIATFKNNEFCMIPIGENVPEHKKDDFVEYGVLKTSVLLPLFDKYTKKLEAKMLESGRLS